MRLLSSLKTPALLFASALTLIGCAETQLIVHGAKKIAGTMGKPVPKTRDTTRSANPIASRIPGITRRKTLATRKRE